MNSRENVVYGKFKSGQTTPGEGRRRSRVDTLVSGRGRAALTRLLVQIRHALRRGDLVLAESLSSEAERDLGRLQSPILIGLHAELIAMRLVRQDRPGDALSTLETTALPAYTAGPFALRRRVERAIEIVRASLPEEPDLDTPAVERSTAGKP